MNALLLIVLSDVQGLGAEEVAIPYNSLVRTGEDYFQLSLGNIESWVGGGTYPYTYPDAYYLASAPGGSDLYGILLL